VGGPSADLRGGVRGSPSSICRGQRGRRSGGRQDPKTGLRMVVNIPAHAFLEFLREHRYRNWYELDVVGGKPARPDPMRQEVDALIFEDRDPSDFYFGALALGGTGVRFYGEYCLVLEDASVPKETQILDRDSFELRWPPLSSDPDPKALAARLKGTWDPDAVPMAITKVLPGFDRADRRATVGQISDALLRDEDFVEVHKRGTFEPGEVHEVRVGSQDVALEEHIHGRETHGHPPTFEEMLWTARREEVERASEEAGCRHRVVSSIGRTERWG